jgi:hypothetical protein
MFKWFQSWRRQGIPRWLSQAYHPLFDVHDRITREMLQLSHTVDFLEDLQKELRNPEGKDDKQKIKERWQALKLEPVLEHYRLTVEKLHEVLVNTPSRPEEGTKYTVEYYNGSDDDL